MKRASVALVIVLVTATMIVVLGRIYFTRMGHTPADQPALVEMNDPALAALRTEFNRASASLRVILLLSPT
jgi:hypothetical protein